MYPKVSIITVNYKQPAVTCELLDSIAGLSYPNLETIVVDNCQAYDDSCLYKCHLPTVKVINVKENSGFAGGNNIGIRASSGEYVLLLNNDTEIENGVIESLIAVLKDDQIGAVSPVLKYHSNKEVQFAGFTEVNSLTGRNKLIKKSESFELKVTPYFHGAAVMIPKRVVDHCGYMPEEYFLYYEELDWSRIIKSCGYELKVLTSVSVLHKESVSTGKNSPLKVYYQNRNRIHFMRKAKKSTWLVFLLFFVFISTPKNVILHLIKRETKHLKAFTKAFYHGLISRKTHLQLI